MLQGGDFTKRNGSGGVSIYGGTFADERLEGEGTEVDREGLVRAAAPHAQLYSTGIYLTPAF